MLLKLVGGHLKTQLLFNAAYSSSFNTALQWNQSILSPLFFVSGVSQTQRFIWTGVIEFVCVVDIIPRRVNKGYATSTHHPHHNKGLHCSGSVFVCGSVGL